MYKNPALGFFKLLGIRNEQVLRTNNFNNNEEKDTYYDKSRRPGEKEITKECQKGQRFRSEKKSAVWGKTVKLNNEYF